MWKDQTVSQDFYNNTELMLQIHGKFHVKAVHFFVTLPLHLNSEQLRVINRYNMVDFKASNS